MSENIMEQFYQQARTKQKRLILPEGGDIRTLTAAAKIVDAGLAAEVILLGEKEQLVAAASQDGVDLSGCTFVSPARDARREEFAATLYELRCAKGMTESEAAEKVLDPLWFGGFLLRTGAADGMVAGAVNSTGDVIRSALATVGMRAGTSCISSFFIMATPRPEFGEGGVILYADCAVIPLPTVEQLVAIAASTADSAKRLLGWEPRIAMLSFSTKGSAHHRLLKRVIEATELVRERYPDLLIDGEIQVDAALLSAIGERKCPGSPVAGKANILIFPDLNSGNIAYKLTERIGGAEAIGPFLQGLNKPINDLSRGCKADDIFNTAAVTLSSCE